MTTDEPWAFDGPPIDDYQFTHVPLNRAPAKKRSGQTPEAKVAKACVAWLELCDFYILRTGSGVVTIEGRRMAVGRAGGHDYTCCAPNGAFVSVETKSATGTPSAGQLRQREFILRRNGVVSIPHSLAELQADMRAAFGDAVVAQWEAAARARAAELKKGKRNT